MKDLLDLTITVITYHMRYFNLGHFVTGKQILTLAKIINLMLVQTI